LTLADIPHTLCQRFKKSQTVGANHKPTPDGS
jgi:hypothetical protein